MIATEHPSLLLENLKLEMCGEDGLDTIISLKIDHILAELAKLNKEIEAERVRNLEILLQYKEEIRILKAKLAKPEPCKTCGGSGKTFPTQKQTENVSAIKIICPRCKGTGIEPACQEPEPIEFTKEWLAEQVGVGVYTGLRKFADSHEAGKAYRAIEEVPLKEWRNICQIVAGVIYKKACGIIESQQAKLDTQQAEIEKHRWILVSERLPEGQWSPNHPHLSEEVLIVNSAATCVGFYNRQDETWYIGEPAKKEWIDKITHWLPLPTSPHDQALKDNK